MRKRLNNTARSSGIPTDVSDTLNATKKKARECCIENAILTNIDYLQKYNLQIFELKFDTEKNMHQKLNQDEQLVKQEHLMAYEYIKKMLI